MKLFVEKFQEFERKMLKEDILLANLRHSKKNRNKCLMMRANSPTKTTEMLDGKCLTVCALLNLHHYVENLNAYL